MAEAGLSSGVRWSGVSVIGREVSRAVFTIALARLVGPDDFGMVAQAMVYMGIVGLLLDQGFSSALIQRKHVEPEMPGVVVSVNLAVGAALAAVTIAIAPLWASFMRSPDLMLVLIVSRSQPADQVRGDHATRDAHAHNGIPQDRYQPTSSSAFVRWCTRLARRDSRRGATGRWWCRSSAPMSFRCWCCWRFGPAGGRIFIFGLLREIAGFSGRAFAAGLLINSVSRNIDNLLVGRFQGAEALAFYALAYRLLLLPVQLAVHNHRHRAVSHVRSARR